MSVKQFGLSKHEAFVLWSHWSYWGLSVRRLPSLFRIFGGETYPEYMDWVKAQQKKRKDTHAK